MEKQEKNNKEYTVDLLYLAKVLLQRIWIIIAAGVLAAVIGFVYSKFIIAPTYSSSVMLYVNNKAMSIGGFSINTGDLTAAQSLVKTYSVILKSRTTLERVIEKADVQYDYKDLAKTIQAESADGTEILRVTVTTKDPYEAANIANTIAEVLPGRVTEIIDGASMEVVDSAIPILDKVAPSVTRYTAVALLIGVVAAAAVIIVIALTDDTIRDEDYIMQTYDYPVLAKIPDLLESGGSNYSRYYYRHSSQPQD